MLPKRHRPIARAAATVDGSGRGGDYTVTVAGKPETVRVYMSTAFTALDTTTDREEIDRTNREWAEAFAKMPHGPELSKLTVYLSPYSEISSDPVCGPQADSCYDPNDGTIYLVGETPPDGAGILQIAMHEYGHHVAANRLNTPWDASGWGPKYWASSQRVCSWVRRGKMWPFDQDTHYEDNPAEIWAETFRIISAKSQGLEPDPWEILNPKWDPATRPAILAAAQRDVTNPWRGRVRSTWSGRLGVGGDRTDTVARSREPRWDDRHTAERIREFEGERQARSQGRLTEGFEGLWRIGRRRDRHPQVRPGPMGPRSQVPVGLTGGQSSRSGPTARSGGVDRQRVVEPALAHSPDPLVDRLRPMVVESRLPHEGAGPPLAATLEARGDQPLGEARAACRGGDEQVVHHADPRRRERLPGPVDGREAGRGPFGVPREQLQALVRVVNQRLTQLPQPIGPRSDSVERAVALHQDEQIIDVVPAHGADLSCHRGIFAAAGDRAGDLNRLPNLCLPIAASCGSSA